MLDSSNQESYAINGSGKKNAKEKTKVRSMHLGFTMLSSSLKISLLSVALFGCTALDPFFSSLDLRVAEYYGDVTLDICKFWLPSSLIRGLISRHYTYEK